MLVTLFGTHDLRLALPCSLLHAYYVVACASCYFFQLFFSRWLLSCPSSQLLCRQRQELIQYNETLRLQRIQVLMNQMSENGGPGAGPANSQSAFQSPNMYSRTNAAHSYSSEGEEEIPGRFRITVPGNMHLNVSDAPPKGVMEGHTSTRALFARQSSRTQDPSTTYSQHLNSTFTPRSHSPGPYWDVSDSHARSQSRQFSHGRSGCHVPQEAPSSTDWGTLWGRREPANTQVV